MRMSKVGWCAGQHPPSARLSVISHTPLQLMMFLLQGLQLAVQGVIGSVRFCQLPAVAVALRSSLCLLAGQVLQTRHCLCMVLTAAS